MGKILITGHKGFVGRYFCELYKDHDITGIDISEGNDVNDFFKANNEHYDLVIHLAKVIESGLFSWALKSKPGRIIHFSSSAAYPVEKQSKNYSYKLKEEDINLNYIQSPDSAYGWSKLMGEHLAQFAQAEGIKVNVFRPFAAYGTDQSINYPFSSFINMSKNKQDPFQIWGDGKQVRDFIHIKDVVNAVDEAIKQDIEGPVNLGWGRPTSLNELASMVTKFNKYDPVIQHLLDKPTGVEYRVCDPSKMVSFYMPEISLEEGVKLALKDRL